jgi:DNA polymerase I-like protein with 3'-5' exonuclease and polymerase domains
MRALTYKFISLDQLKVKLDFSKPCMFDTETIDLYGKIRIAQFYQRHFDENGTAVAYIVENPNVFELLQLLTDLIIVGHNIHYDISTIQENIGLHAWMPKEFHDTMLLARLYFYTKEKFSLDEVVKYTVNEDIYNGTKSEFHKADWNVPVLSHEQLMYAAIDVVYLHDVFDTVKESIDDISYKLDMLCLRYCLDFQQNGLPVDGEKLNATYAENMKELNLIALPINCNSFVQVRQYINSNLSDDKGLALLSAQGNERAKLVRKARKLTKQNSFLIKFLETTRNGCIFGKFKPSARSGRLTSDDQNLQQIPRKLKSIFAVEADGDTVLLYSDFAQIQLRAVCAITADERMEALFRAGEDLHNYVARFIFGENFTPEERQICKTANFSLLFGAGIEVFKTVLLKDAGMFLTDAEASKIKSKWLKLWRQIAEWQEKGAKDWRKKIPWETPLGRKYTAKMMTDQLAMQIQGFEAEVAKLALHYMLPKLTELDSRIKLVNFIHDSYMFICPNDKELYSKACKIIADSMQEGWQQMSQSVSVRDLPMPVKVRVGFNWGEIEKDKYIFEHQQ